MFKPRSVSTFGTHAIQDFSRSLWSRGQKYPQEAKETWTIITKCFNGSTLHGEKIDPTKMFQQLLKHSPDILYRGAGKKEADCQYNQTLHGVVGRNPSVFRKSQEEVAKAMREHQKGDVKGISTSTNYGMGKSYGRGSSGELLIVDKKNIPEGECYEQEYFEGSSGLVDITGESSSKDYSTENEWTASALHVSAIPARISRVLLKATVEFNPLYVDQVLLNDELKQDYRTLLKHFYDLIQPNAARNEEVIRDYYKLELDFYDKLGDYLNYDAEHKKAISDFLDKNQTLKLEPPKAEL